MFWCNIAKSRGNINPFNFPHFPCGCITVLQDCTHTHGEIGVCSRCITTWPTRYISCPAHLLKSAAVRPSVKAAMFLMNADNMVMCTGVMCTLCPCTLPGPPSRRSMQISKQSFERKKWHNLFCYFPFSTLPPRASIIMSPQVVVHTEHPTARPGRCSVYTTTCGLIIDRKSVV